jgi:hypothetical protein
MQQMQKYRKANIPHSLRRAVWNTCIGEDIGSTECYVGCKTKISQMTFECGHIEAESKGGLTVVENLRPICSPCNKSMGTKNMHDFIKTFGFKSDIVEDNEIIDMDVNDNNMDIEENKMIVDDNLIVVDENISYPFFADKPKRESSPEASCRLVPSEPSPEASCRLVPSEPINYFIENCIEYKKGTKISFNNMYELFNGFCPAYYDKEIVLHC